MGMWLWCVTLRNDVQDVGGSMIMANVKEQDQNAVTVEGIIVLRMEDVR